MTKSRHSAMVLKRLLWKQSKSTQGPTRSVQIENWIGLHGLTCLHLFHCRQESKSGKLGIGYGASDDKIGPEFSFGLSGRENRRSHSSHQNLMGKEVTQLQFPPPSLPDFKTTRNTHSRRRLENLERYEAAIKSFPQDMEKYQSDLAAYNEQMKTADEKERKKLQARGPPAT